MVAKVSSVVGPYHVGLNSPLEASEGSMTRPAIDMDGRLRMAFTLAQCIMASIHHGINASEPNPESYFASRALSTPRGGGSSLERRPFPRSPWPACSRVVESCLMLGRVAFSVPFLMDTGMLWEAHEKLTWCGGIG